MAADKEILVFLNFIWFDVNVWAAVPVVFVAFLTILSLARLVGILLSRVLFNEKRILLLKDRIQDLISIGLQERIADNQFFFLLDGQENITQILLLLNS